MMTCLFAILVLVYGEGVPDFLQGVLQDGDVASGTTQHPNLRENLARVVNYKRFKLIRDVPVVRFENRMSRRHIRVYLTFS